MKLNYLLYFLTVILISGSCQKTNERKSVLKYFLGKPILIPQKMEIEFNNQKKENK